MRVQGSGFRIEGLKGLAFEGLECFRAFEGV